MYVPVVINKDINRKTVLLSCVHFNTAQSVLGQNKYHVPMLIVLQSPVRSWSYCLFWKDREPVWSQKASECKNRGPELQKTGRNWSRNEYNKTRAKSVEIGLVFKGPVAWTGKGPETGPNRTDLDRTAVAVAPPFRMDEPPATGCNRLEISLQNPFKKHLKTLKMIKI